MIPSPLPLVPDLPSPNQGDFLTDALYFKSLSLGYICRGKAPLCLVKLVSIVGFAGLPIISLFLDFVRETLLEYDRELRLAMALRAAICASDSHCVFSYVVFGRVYARLERTRSGSL